MGRPTHAPTWETNSIRPQTDFHLGLLLSLLCHHSIDTTLSQARILCAEIEGPAQTIFFCALDTACKCSIEKNASSHQLQNRAIHSSGK